MLQKQICTSVSKIVHPSSSESTSKFISQYLLVLKKDCIRMQDTQLCPSVCNHYLKQTCDTSTFSILCTFINQRYLDLYIYVYIHTHIYAHTHTYIYLANKIICFKLLILDKSCSRRARPGRSTFCTEDVILPPVQSGWLSWVNFFTCKMMHANKTKPKQRRQSKMFSKLCNRVLTMFIQIAKSG